MKGFMTENAKLIQLVLQLGKGEAMEREFQSKFSYGEYPTNKTCLATGERGGNGEGVAIKVL